MAGRDLMLRQYRAIIVIALISIAFAGHVAGASLEMRGEVQLAENESELAWNTNNFPGFYYDIDQNAGNEMINLTLAYGRFSEPDGILYTTSKHSKNFEFDKWGSYDVIGFLGEPYLAGYSGGENLIETQNIFRVLLDDDDERTIASGFPLELAEGYQLKIKSLDESLGTITLQLEKNGKIVDTQSLPGLKDDASIAEKTYIYKKDIGNLTNYPIIRTNIKNGFSGSSSAIATVGGVFQISDTPTSLDIDHQYGALRIATTDPDTIAMDNKDNTISIDKKMDVNLIGDIHLKAANQGDVSAENPLRLCITKKITEPGTYEIRSTVAAMSAGSEYQYSTQNFPGFFYDLDRNIGAEQMDISFGENTIDEPSGIVYSTQSQEVGFDFDEWGYYQVIGFMGNKYFAGYSPREDDFGPSYLTGQSVDDNLLADKQLTEILLDDDTRRVFKKNESVKLKQGYELLIQGVNQDGMVMLELQKDGLAIDNNMVYPSVEGATLADKTYVYKSGLGTSEDVVIIAVHFKNAYRDESQAAVTVDGVWQISDQPISVAPDTKFDQMSIASLTSDGITMDNKGNSIALFVGRDAVLMGDICLRMGRQKIVDEEHPLKGYIYRKVLMEPAT
jgi:S-layer protein (TIGR01567 family)